MSSPRRFTSASARAARPTSPTSSFQPCATNSAATWKSRRKADAGDARMQEMTPANEPASGGETGVKAAPPCAMVIFGAAGDLTKRLLVPALYELVRAKRLPQQFQLVGVATRAQTTADWRQNLGDMMNEFVAHGGGEFQADRLDETAWKW